MRIVTLALICLMLHGVNQPLLRAQASGAEATQDLVFSWEGSARKGTIMGITNDYLKFSVELPGGAGSAEVSIPRRQIKRISFAQSPEAKAALQNGDAAELAKLWQQREPYLNIENSDSGQFGLAYAEALLERAGEGDAALAIDIFGRIEANDWNRERRAQANNGRLRGMIADGMADQAVEQARALADQSEDPEVLIEAKYVLATAASKQLAQLLDENPRWQEDQWVRPERNRLYHEALNLYLFPYLFYGTYGAEAARGLWGAIEIYQQAGENDLALQTARDLVVLYQDTREADKAKTLLENNEPASTDATTEEES